MGDVFRGHGTLAGRRTLIFADVWGSPPPEGRRSSGALRWFARGADWRGFRGTLSPDGKWVLASSGENLVLLPTGAGAMVTLPKGDVVRVGEGSWLSDSKRIVFTGETRDGMSRGYIQEVPAGIPRAITNDGVVLAGKAAVRDETSVLGRVGATWTLFPIQGGEGRPRSSAHAWRYPASMEPWRPIPVYGRQRRGGQAGGH